VVDGANVVVVVDVVIIGADVVVVVRFSELPVPEQSEAPSPIISIVAAEDFDIEQSTPGVIPVPCASNPIDFKREFISCAGGV
jgi:hypothetical protein